jgi:hypothetical protein
MFVNIITCIQLVWVWNSIEQAQASHVYSYRHGFRGFAAKLTDHQAFQISSEHFPSQNPLFPDIESENNGCVHEQRCREWFLCFRIRKEGYTPLTRGISWVLWARKPWRFRGIPPRTKLMSLLVSLIPVSTLSLSLMSSYYNFCC